MSSLIRGECTAGSFSNKNLQTNPDSSRSDYLFETATQAQPHLACLLEGPCSAASDNQLMSHSTQCHAGACGLSAPQQWTPTPFSSSPEQWHHRLRSPANSCLLICLQVLGPL